MYHNTLLNHPDKLLTHWAHNKFQWVRKCGLTSALPSTYVHSLGVKVTSVKIWVLMIVGSVKTCFFFYFTYKILRKLTCHRTHTFLTFALHMLFVVKKKRRKEKHPLYFYCRRLLPAVNNFIHILIFILGLISNMHRLHRNKQIWSGTQNILPLHKAILPQN